MLIPLARMTLFFIELNDMLQNYFVEILKIISSIRQEMAEETDIL